MYLLLNGRVFRIEVLHLRLGAARRLNHRVREVDAALAAAPENVALHRSPRARGLRADLHNRNLARRIGGEAVDGNHYGKPE